MSKSTIGRNINNNQNDSSFSIVKKKAPHYQSQSQTKHQKKQRKVIKFDADFNDSQEDQYPGQERKMINELQLSHKNNLRQTPNHVLKNDSNMLLSTVDQNESQKQQKKYSEVQQDPFSLDQFKEIHTFMTFFLNKDHKNLLHNLITKRDAYSKNQNRIIIFLSLFQIVFDFQSLSYHFEGQSDNLKLILNQSNKSNQKYTKQDYLKSWLLFVLNQYHFQTKQLESILGELAKHNIKYLVHKFIKQKRWDLAETFANIEDLDFRERYNLSSKSHPSLHIIQSEIVNNIPKSNWLNCMSLTLHYFLSKQEVELSKEVLKKYESNVQILQPQFLMFYFYIKKFDCGEYRLKVQQVLDNFYKTKFKFNQLIFLLIVLSQNRQFKAQQEGLTQIILDEILDHHKILYQREKTIKTNSNVQSKQGSLKEIVQLQLNHCHLVLLLIKYLKKGDATQKIILSFFDSIQQTQFKFHLIKKYMDVIKTQITNKKQKSAEQLYLSNWQIINRFVELFENKEYKKCLHFIEDNQQIISQNSPHQPLVQKIVERILNTFEYIANYKQSFLLDYRRILQRFRGNVKLNKIFCKRIEGAIQFISLRLGQSTVYSFQSIQSIYQYVNLTFSQQYKQSDVKFPVFFSLSEINNKSGINRIKNYVARKYLQLIKASQLKKQIFSREMVFKINKQQKVLFSKFILQKLSQRQSNQKDITIPQNFAQTHLFKYLSILQWNKQISRQLMLDLLLK